MSYNKIIHVTYYAELYGLTGESVSILNLLEKNLTEHRRIQTNAFGNFRFCRGS